MSQTTKRKAKTIHRSLEYKQGEGWSYNTNNPLKVSGAICDESSMNDVVLSSSLLNAVEDNSQVVFVGDVDQLPSVSPGMFLYDLIRSQVVPTFKLTKTFRQKEGAAIIDNCHRINQGLMINPNLPMPSDFFFIEAATDEKILEEIKTLVDSRIEKTFNIKQEDIQVLCPQNVKDVGATAINKMLQNLINKESESVFRFDTEYKLFDKVIQTKNNKKKDVYNGDTGIISKINADGSIIVLTEEGEVEYSFSELNELNVAHAITIHKSQGSEYPCVIIPVSESNQYMLERSLLFTAASRGKELTIFVGSKPAMKKGIKKTTSKNRMTTLHKRLKKYATTL